jgi:hypothetical protein
VKTLLLLSILAGGQVEVVVVPTADEPTCRFVEREMQRAMQLPVVDPSAPRIVAAECSDTAPDDAATLEPEFPL